jgi:RHS repeat-associated protein
VSAKRYRYIGCERDDETGLYLMGARYYAAWLGRWTAADPAGTVDGTNLFAYVRGSPIGLRDPSGTQSGGYGYSDAEDEINDAVPIGPKWRLLQAQRKPVITRTKIRGNRKLYASYLQAMRTLGDMGLRTDIFDRTLERRGLEFRDTGKQGPAGKFRSMGDHYRMQFQSEGWKNIARIGTDWPSSSAGAQVVVHETSHGGISGGRQAKFRHRVVQPHIERHFNFTRDEVLELADEYIAFQLGNATYAYHELALALQDAHTPEDLSRAVRAYETLMSKEGIAYFSRKGAPDGKVVVQLRLPEASRKRLVKQVLGLSGKARDDARRIIESDWGRRNINEGRRAFIREQLHLATAPPTRRPAVQSGSQNR